MSGAGVGRCVFALDIGGTKVMGGVVARDGTVLHKRRMASDHSGGPEAFMASLASFSHEVIEESGLAAGDLDAVGMTAPGLVDSARGMMLYGPHTGWRDVPYGPYIGDLLGLPHAVGNDVNACAQGEMAFGVARDVPDFVWMTISTGIGGAVVVDGRVYEGSSGISGEFGHLVVADGGPQCDCGNRGCLEAVASGSAIARRASGRFLAERPNQEAPRTAQELASLASGGDKLALSIFHEAGEHMGKGLSYVVNILNPALVVLGGGVSQTAHPFLPALLEALRSRVISDANKSVKVVTTGLGYDAGLLGAAALAFARIGDGQSIHTMAMTPERTGYR